LDPAGLIRFTLGDDGRLLTLLIQDNVGELLTNLALEDKLNPVAGREEPGDAVVAQRVCVLGVVRQRALLRNDPALGAYAVMALDSGGTDRELDAAGRRHDDYVNAERRGVAGFGHRFTQKG